MEQTNTQTTRPVVETKNAKDYGFEPEEKVELKPWVRELDDGKYAVNTPDGVFELQEVDYEVISNARKKAEATGKSDEIFILPKMIVAKNGIEKQLGELSVLKLKGKTMTRLLWVMNELLGVSDFLSDIGKS